MSAPRTGGVLREGWQATLDDYAIAGAWSHGGELLVVTDAQGSLYALETRSGALRWTRPTAHPGGSLALAVDPERRQIASAGQDGRVRLWSAADGTAGVTLAAGEGWVEHLAWSPDGARIAAACGREVSVWDQDGRRLLTLEEHPSTVSAIAWQSPSELATACYGRVSFFELPQGRASQCLAWKGSLVSMVLSPDADVVACGSQDNSVHFWRRSTGKDSMMTGYSGKPSALAFDAAGELLATGGGPTVIVWRFSAGGPEGTSPGLLDLHDAPVRTLRFAHRRRRLASAGRDRAVIVWDLAGDGSGEPVGVGVTQDKVEQVLWHPDDCALAALDASGTVCTWRIEPGPVAPGRAHGPVQR